MENSIKITLPKIKESSILQRGHKARDILEEDSLKTSSGIQPIPKGGRMNTQAVMISLANTNKTNIIRNTVAKLTYEEEKLLNLIRSSESVKRVVVEKHMRVEKLKR